MIIFVKKQTASFVLEKSNQNDNGILNKMKQECTSTKKIIQTKQQIIPLPVAKLAFIDISTTKEETILVKMTRSF